MPRVFVSWSGEKSLIVAKVMHIWLPVVLQTIKPFISTDDLSKGGRWNTELSLELEKDSFGIICLTPSNLQAPWILFEAGALSKSVGESHVAPFLVGVKPSDLPPPLTQFNAVLAEKEDFKKLIKSINAREPSEQVAADTVDRSIEACWPRIEEELKEAAEPIAAKAGASKSQAADAAVMIEKFDAILQELLVLNRSQTKILSDPEQFFPISILRDLRRFDRPDGLPSADHGVWEDLFHNFDLLQSAVSKQSAVDPAVSAAVENLEGPVNYLRRRLSMSLMRGHRSAAARLRASVPDQIVLPDSDSKGAESA
jgi:hypothetical protein